MFVKQRSCKKEDTGIKIELFYGKSYDISEFNYFIKYQDLCIVDICDIEQHNLLGTYGNFFINLFELNMRYNYIVKLDDFKSQEIFSIPTIYSFSLFGEVTVNIFHNSIFRIVFNQFEKTYEIYLRNNYILVVRDTIQQKVNYFICQNIFDFFENFV